MSTRGHRRWGNMDFATIFILAMVGAVIVEIGRRLASGDKKRSITSRFESISNFAPTHSFTATDGNSGIAIDHDRKKVCLLTYRDGSIVDRVVSYKDILSVEVYEDGKSVTKTSRTSQLGGVAIGAVALGGVGAIIGGLSGKTTSSKKTEHVELRLMINDSREPLHDIVFLHNKEGLLDSKQAILKARTWHGRLEVLIKEADQQERQNRQTSEIKRDCETAPKRQERRPEPQAHLPSASLADEIRKLSDLRTSGAITEDEFQKLKGKLMAAS